MAILEGIGFYLLLCLLSILAGQGILRLLGLGIERSLALFLAPVLTLTFWSVMLGLGISLGFPVKALWKFVWPLTLMMIFLGLKEKHGPSGGWEWIFLGAVTILPAAVMGLYFAHGLRVYMGSPLPDGWSYVAYGQYLWEYARGTEGGLSPLYQYAAHLNGTRFIASGLLGFFSPLIGTRGDTQAASGFFLAWSLFVFSSSCMFFFLARRTSARGIYPILYVGLCSFSGWIANLLWANNYDNALAISFLPAFSGIILQVVPTERRWIAPLSGLSAAVLYCYPELAAPILGGAFLLFGQRFWPERKNFHWLLLLLLSGIVTALLIAPFARDLFSFLRGQVGSSLGNSGVRPGEGFFQELLSAQFGVAAFWGFNRGSEAGFALHQFLAAGLSILACLGTLNLFKKKEWALGVLLILLVTGSLAMIFWFRYSYGAYKLILLNWWALAYVVACGIQIAVQRWPSRKFRTGISLFLLLFFVVQGVKSLTLIKPEGNNSITPFKEVERIPQITKNQPFLVDVDDGRANQWAVYFLKNSSFHLLDYRLYMAQVHVVPFMERAKTYQDSEAHYLLADQIGLFSFAASRALWSSGPYFLWKMDDDDWVAVTRLINPNGIENWGGDPGFWLGKNESEIRLFSPRRGQLIIQGFFTPGPSIPDRKERRLQIRTDEGFASEVAIPDEGVQIIRLPVAKGRNSVALRALDEPTRFILPNGDKRSLLLGVRGLKMNLEEPR